ncbi:MAG: outer membrane beta-barrel protein [Bacteroidales bacterium]|nr:outer membrane beta-barrel protein [Bacteroidales bacterium]MBR4838795.1 outer membrane beta-barrel protein [Bacteroidales bacterium]
MRRKFYFLLFAMMISFVATAQRFEYQFGLKGGLGVDFLSANEDITNKDNGFCYKFGLTGIYYFGENYGITSGFNIIGHDLSYYKPEKVSLSNTYFQIPVLLKMRTDAFASKFRIFGEIGYGLDLLVKENDEHNYRDVCSSFIMHLGLEVEVLNRSALQFMVAYDNVFSSMLSDGNNKLTMNNLCFEIGFLF